MDSQDQRRQLVVAFLDTAWEDALSARALCFHKKYAQSIFLLQQSSEKAVKAFALAMDYISLEDLENRRKAKAHNVAKIFRIVLDKELHKVQALLDRAESMPEIRSSKGVKVLRQYRDRLARWQGVYANILSKPQTAYEYVLARFRDRTLSRLVTDAVEETRTFGVVEFDSKDVEISSVDEIVREYFPKITVDEQQLSQVSKRLVSSISFLKDTIYGIQAYFLISIVAVLLYPLVEFVRYPSPSDPCTPGHRLQRIPEIISEIETVVPTYCRVFPKFRRFVEYSVNALDSDDLTHAH